MKKLLVIVMVTALLFVHVFPAKASIYSDSFDYIVNVVEIIVNGTENDLGSFQGLHICQYDDISKVWGRDSPRIEDAFMIDAKQMPDEGYLFALTFTETFFALVSLDGVIISIQNMTENERVASALVSAFKAIDRSKISDEEYKKAHEYIHSLLIRNLALSLLNWDSSSLFADGDLNSSVKNVWH